MTTPDGPHSEYGPGVRPTDPAMREIHDAATRTCRRLARLGVALAGEQRKIDEMHERARA